MLTFKTAFLLSSFTLIKNLFSSSSLSAIRVTSSAYLRLLIFLLSILIPACEEWGEIRTVLSPSCGHYFSRLNCFSFVSASSLISYCLYLLFGTQGGPRKLKPLATNKKWGYGWTSVPEVLLHFSLEGLLAAKQQTSDSRFYGTSLAVQWLRLHASTARGTALIPGQGIKIPRAVWHCQKKKRKYFMPVTSLNSSLAVSLQDWNAEPGGSFLAVIQLAICPAKW